METSWLHSKSKYELYSSSRFWCELRPCPKIWSSNSAVCGEVPLKPGGILCTEFTPSGISALPLLTIKSTMTVTWVAIYLFIHPNKFSGPRGKSRCFRHLHIKKQTLFPEFTVRDKRWEGKYVMKCFSTKFPEDNDIVERFISLLAGWPHPRNYNQRLSLWVETANKWCRSVACTETNNI